MIKDPTEALFHWFSKHKERLATIGIEVKFTKQTEATGAYLDLFSHSWAGRITVWETGECDCELMSDSGKQLLWQHHQGIDVERLAPLVELLAHQIINQSLESAN